MAAITQAFVLGAGLGTRLRPLTDDLPKPLVPIFQKRLITFALDHLIDLGIRRFYINTHHLPERFGEIFPEAMYRGNRIKFFHEPELLETAGGIANVAPSLGNGPLLVYNGDILTDLPLASLLDSHFRAGNLVTLALRSNAEPKHVAFDPGNGRIIDIGNQIGTDASQEFVFTGIYLVDPKFVDLLDRGVKRSVIPHFVDLIRRGERIGGVVIDKGHWWDVRDRGSYIALHQNLPSLKFPSYRVDDVNWMAPIHQTAVVDPTATVIGWSAIGRDCRVGPGAALENTIVWPGSQIASTSRLFGCIVRTHKSVSGIYRDTDI